VHSEDIALVFFDSLERAENALLAWGVVDSFFAEEELVERAEVFLEARPFSMLICFGKLRESRAAIALGWQKQCGFLLDCGKFSRMPLKTRGD
jgi:hypothetical protein